MIQWLKNKLKINRKDKNVPFILYSRDGIYEFYFKVFENENIFLHEKYIIFRKPKSKLYGIYKLNWITSGTKEYCENIACIDVEGKK